VTFEYSNDPAISTKDEVRFLIGDTVEDDAQFQDEEIEFLITSEGTAIAAALRGARVLALRYAGLVDKSVGDLKLSYSQRAKGYADTADRIQSGGGTARPVPYAGGISVADKIATEEDDDRVQPGIERGQDDNRGVNRDGPVHDWWL
jgi:hypothetical protein